MVNPHIPMLKHGYIMYGITNSWTPVTLVLMVKNRFYTCNCIHANVLHVRTLWYIKSNQILDTMVYQIKSNSLWFRCSSISLVIAKLATSVQFIKSHTYYIILSHILQCATSAYISINYIIYKHTTAVQYPAGI